MFGSKAILRGIVVPFVVLSWLASGFSRGGETASKWDAGEINQSPFDSTFVGEVDLGSQKRGSRVEGVVLLENKLDRTVAIDEILTGCGCLKADVLTEKVEPRGNLRLRVTVQVPAHPVNWRIAKPISVYHNGSLCGKIFIQFDLGEEILFQHRFLAIEPSRGKETNIVLPLEMGTWQGKEELSVRVDPSSEAIKATLLPFERKVTLTLANQEKLAGTYRVTLLGGTKIYSESTVLIRSNEDIALYPSVCRMSLIPGAENMGGSSTTGASFEGFLLAKIPADLTEDSLHSVEFSDAVAVARECKFERLSESAYKIFVRIENNNNRTPSDEGILKFRFNDGRTLDAHLRLRFLVAP